MIFFPTLYMSSEGVIQIEMVLYRLGSMDRVGSGVVNTMPTL